MFRLVESFELELVSGGQDTELETPEIIVVGHKPNTVSASDGAGGTWSYQFYSDGIAMVSHNGVNMGAWEYSMDVKTEEVTVEASVPPSISSTANNVTYHLTERVGEYNPDLQTGPHTPRMPD